MDEESSNGFPHGIGHYQDLKQQFIEPDAEDHAAAAQPSTGDDQLAGAAAGAESPPNNHQSPGHLLQDPRLRAIMETLYNDDDFLQGGCSAASDEPPPHDDGGSFDHNGDDLMDYTEFDEENPDFQVVFSREDYARFAEMRDQGLHEEAYDFLTQRVERDQVENFRAVMEYALGLAEAEYDHVYFEDILELIYETTADGSFIAQLAQAVPAMLDHDYSYGVPASSAAVASLGKQKFQDLGDEEHRECPICLKDYEADDELSVMPCTYRHRYHQGCLAKWLERNNSCPLCRHALPTMDQQEHDIQY